MTRKRKICVDLTGRSSEQKDRIVERIEKVIEEEDRQQENSVMESEENV